MNTVFVYGSAKWNLSLCVCVCVWMRMWANYMHACACIRLRGRERTSSWHVDAKPTRAVPYACFSVTLHLHLTAILQIPNVALRGLASIGHDMVPCVENNDTLFLIMLCTNIRIPPAAAFGDKISSYFSIKLLCASMVIFIFLWPV